MRFTLVLILFVTLSFSASAQWYNSVNNIFKKHERFPPIAEINIPHRTFQPSVATTKVKIPKYTFTGETDFVLEAQEAIIMRSAQHHMRFREYDEASYEFTQLAELYIKQNRFSEAKWYLLQSNSITRQQADDMHTIVNLEDLAMVKANLGDLLQSEQDLNEAHELALARGWTAGLAEIEKEQRFIKINKTASSPKLEARYASDALVTDKKAADKKVD
jgi:hypothetical protein